MSIKTMSVQSRPREHAAAVGIQNISDQELLAIIIASGSHGHSALALASEILEKTGGLDNLSSANIDSLKLKGLGKVKKMEIKAAIELGKRSIIQNRETKPVLREPQMIYQYCYPKYCGLLCGRFTIILLDTKFRFVFENSYDEGELNKLSFSLSWVLKVCASNLSPYAVIIHNHPSGQVLPSRQDDETTYSLRQALSLMGVNLYDHVILSDEDYFSYREEGRLKQLANIITKEGMKS